ncbi:hypothetical protein D8Y22_12310 [Salinadaptatus halalkaliphilus]|uniref:Uncharacterized protein n=1 Tax=Salinadaptatus halalkaliphilus TaxID=2419781 RepID=A0A4S3TKF1_9EURY|nr:hypothetical protein [Salinadaptatus halalkaliphilus]THE64604.1 hypothetical protein D8Y22_12310 [Salinadaptatus halalkaliphilus]
MALELPASMAQSWHQCGTRTAETNVAIATITAEMTLFEPLEPALPQRTASAVPVRSLFTVDIDVAPPLSAVEIDPSSALSMAAPTVKSQFVTTIEDEGLVVEATRDSLEFEAANGAAGAWYVLDIVYPIQDEAGDRSTLEAEANVAIWPTDSTFGIAGGILPLETARDATAGSTVEPSPIPTLEVDPTDDRKTISQVVRSLDVEDGDA